MTHRFPALIAAPSPAQGRLWLTGARLFDGTGAPLRENTAILVEDGVRQGVDTIEHGMYLHRRPDLLEAMAASGQVLVPTLSGYYWMAGLGEAVDPATARADPEMPPVLSELAQHNLVQRAASMRAARQAGVKVALGSDVVDGDPLREPQLLADPGRIWLVLQRGVPVAGLALVNPAP